MERINLPVGADAVSAVRAVVRACAALDTPPLWAALADVVLRRVDRDWSEYDLIVVVDACMEAADVADPVADVAASHVHGVLIGICHESLDGGLSVRLARGDGDEWVISATGSPEDMARMRQGGV